MPKRKAILHALLEFYFGNEMWLRRDKRGLLYAVDPINSSTVYRVSPKKA